MKLKNKIKNHEARVGILGMGYVGLPLAVGFAEAGFPVTGFDIDADKVDQLNSGHSPVEDVESSRLQALVNSGSFEATDDMGRLGEMDCLSICVPTPLRKSRDPDISFIAQATETIVENFSPPGLIILESTTYPGTTDEILAEAFKEAGWDLENELFLAFSPERIDPGNKEYGLHNTPKVVGGYSKQAGDLVSAFYGEVVGEVVELSTTKAAEMVKLLENTFRSINIGLVNEMALICDRLDINVWEVIKGASSKPFGFMPFYPGPGLGGHCIPIDPLFLSWRARLHNTSTRFIELADEINRSMPNYVFRKITEGLNEFEKSVRGSKICVFGVAYKPDVADTRESPAVEVISKLVEQGAEVDYCDPHVEKFDVAEKEISRVTTDQLDEKDYDAGVIITDHEIFDFNSVLEEIPLVVDTRNALDETFDRPADLRVVKI